MPEPGLAWWHLRNHTKNAWLPGDPRGFRSHDHRIHSSGDYKHRPPKDEHAGLHAFHQNRSDPPVTLPAHLRISIRDTILRKAISQGHKIAAIAICNVHLHIVAQLPVDARQVKRIFGTWKQAASHAARESIPGHLWAENSSPLLIEGQQHLTNAVNYIIAHEEEGAAVWRYDDAIPFDL